MKAYIYIANFGSYDQKTSLIDCIHDVTGWTAILKGDGEVALVIPLEELGPTLAALAGDSATNWIEYTIQFHED